MIGTKYQQLAIRVDALQLRERMLLLLVSIVLLFLLVDRIGLQPLFKQHQLLLQDIKDQGLQIEVLRARSSLINDETGSEPTIPLAKLQRELSSLGPKLQFRIDGMLAPDKAASILEQVISREEGLTLNAVYSRLTPLTSIEADTVRSMAIDNINRYELELQLEGGYLETLNYLRALEALPWKFFWSDITFAITDYPKASVNLEIYTLGQPGN